tara:strand:- start:550 stop:1359 length:810 start_codon:yes stop_codon:yes gene_type:complete
MKNLPSEYDFLIPNKTSNLYRLGIEKDGGYILDQEFLKKSKFLISFGMAEEYSFEKDFLNLNNENKLVIFDFSINHFHYFKEILKNFRRIIKLKRTLNDLLKCLKNYLNFLNFINKKNVKFYSKKISSVNNEGNNITIKKIFENLSEKDKRNITFKIDIEGSEYEIIDKILSYEKNIDQLIIEFHDTHIKKFEFFNNIKKLQKYFHVTHIHANNYRDYNQDGFPINVEVSFFNKSLKGSTVKNYDYPINNLDFPNNPDYQDLKFSFRKS